MDTRDFEQLLVMLGRLTRGQRDKVQQALTLNNAVTNARED